MDRVQNKQMCLMSLLLLLSPWAIAQNGNTLSVDSCLVLSKRNYPQIKQFSLIEKTKEYSIENANKGFLPQLNIYGQATYQSAVTEVPISLPNVVIPTPPKDQYRLYGEISQPITDLFVVKDQKTYINVNSEIETQKIEVELYKLRERVNNLFFGILIIDAQIQQTELLKKDIQSGIDKTSTAIANGVALKSTSDNLKAELLKTNQRTIELKATRKGYAEMLSLLTGKTINDNTVFAKPLPQVVSTTVNRPELKMFDLQKKSFDAQKKLITAKTLPRFSLFFQGGIGRPALNSFSNDAESYYIGGLRLSWNLTGFYTYGNEKKTLTINQSAIDVQQETFLFNTNLTLKQQSFEIMKMQELLVADKEIIELRERVKNTAQNQLTYGTTTTNDYLTAVNAEDQAKQNLILHEIQLLMNQYNAQATSGN